MAILRFKALKEILDRKAVEVTPPSDMVSDYYGMNVFSLSTMRKFLPQKAFEVVMEANVKGKVIDRKIADQIAACMKAWAISKGVTHYTHWFQPLTGATAEKHDAFFNPSETGHSIETFDGDKLSQQEPDASSFPSGGIRNTFEARGYTAWDPSSPAFIIGKTLCIPTIFVSYTGEALDYKTPLIKSLAVLDESATSVCQYFDKSIRNVKATLGWEQEYFLIDAALYYARPDLMLTGRTLFGHSSSKGQQLEDHYFGSIPDRANAFMRDFETEAFKLGIPVKTRHNEVAPNQFECAPVFEEINLSVDHNQLLMDIMDKVARRHNFRVLLHEKPFQGINGSGKHNNWSMVTNTGVNLLSPGANPKANLRFLTFFINVIKAVHDYDELLRASIASAGNDHRLGANEAPPAIISVFIGSQLTSILNELEQKVVKGKMSPEQKTELKLNIGKIPKILLDNTDRNRTSPFAFTGNRFEFRAVGSSANCSSSMTVLCTAVTKQLKIFKKEVDYLIENSISKDEAIFRILRGYIKHSKNILFEGNNYSKEWEKEAAKRKLKNTKTTPDAVKAFISNKSISLFEDMGVLTERELIARNAIYLQNYRKKIQIESRMAGDLAINHIIPAAIKYHNQLLESWSGYKATIKKNSDIFLVSQSEIIDEIAQHIVQIRNNVNTMVEHRKKANKEEDISVQSQLYCHKVLPLISTIRHHVDKLELLVDDDLWPLPKYREFLFIK